MKFYQEITIIDSTEKPFFKIWSELYTQLHLALVEQAKATYGEEATKIDIGVSFPEYACSEKNGETIAMLGSKLRVFAKTREELTQLDLEQWCERLLDYVHIKSIDEVGSKATGQVLVKRFRQEANPDSKAINFAKKRGRDFQKVKQSRIEHLAEKLKIDLAQAKALYENPELKNLPYIRMTSLNNKGGFSLMVEQKPVTEKTTGTFSTYGLSLNATVPHW